MCHDVCNGKWNEIIFEPYVFIFKTVYLGWGLKHTMYLVFCFFSGYPFNKTLVALKLVAS